MRLEDYIDIVGEDVIADIHRAAQPLSGKSVLHVNATYYGGGVAEMLHTILPLMNAMGLDADWSLLYGHPDLFHMTKKLHNGLQGESVDISQAELATYLSVNEAFARYTPIMHDAVIIHDPQPLPSIHFRTRNQPWIWRCHIDPSAPSEDVWNLLKPYIAQYDAMVVSAEAFRKPDLPVKTYIVPPAIDPFSAINRDMTIDEVNAKLGEYNIPQDKPLVVQVSRFDKWKDPVGVLDVFERIHKEVDCRLVMLGNMAGDDPEGPAIYQQVAAKAAQMTDVHLITKTDPVLVNALQRAAAVVLQLSLKEGFGLTVSEALWKGTPVIATHVGGIPLQIEDGKMGYLTAPKDYATMSERALAILASHDLGASMGAAGREHVRQRFLMTRLLLDWLKLINEVLHA